MYPLGNFIGKIKLLLLENDIDTERLCQFYDAQTHRSRVFIRNWNIRSIYRQYIIQLCHPSYNDSFHLSNISIFFSELDSRTRTSISNRILRTRGIHLNGNISIKNIKMLFMKTQVLEREANDQKDFTIFI